MSKNKLTAVVIDDEQLAREDLKRILNEISAIEVIGEAKSLEDAIEKCKSLNPDIIFLDIQLGNNSGFDLVEHLPEKRGVVFVTAYDEFAIKAFEVNAYDYLLKPVTRERILQTIEKLPASVENSAPADTLSLDDNVFLKLDSKYQFVKVASIKYISSADDYSEIKIDGAVKGKLAYKTLREWEERLPLNHFCRIHRFTIVNINFIESIEPWHNYSYKVYLKDESKPLLMSRRYFSTIKNNLG